MAELSFRLGNVSSRGLRMTVLVKFDEDFVVGKVRAGLVSGDVAFLGLLNVDDVDADEVPLWFMLFNRLLYIYILKLVMILTLN